MTKVSPFIYPLLLLFLFSCKAEKREIQFGIEACVYCKMIIVDDQFATETVSSKGKVHVFDSIECMLDYLTANETEDFALYFVSDYARPGELIEAQKSTIFQSENLPSPMGQNLSAFGSESTALLMQNEKGGTIHSWADLLLKYDLNPNISAYHIASQ